MKRRRKKKSPRRRPLVKRSSSLIWTISALDGLQDLVRKELMNRFRKDCEILKHSRNAEIHFYYTGPRQNLLTITTAQTLLLRRDFNVARPRTLLHAEHIAKLTELVMEAQSIKGSEPVSSFRIDAAGSGSPTMLRLAEELESALSLPFSPNNGDCLLVLRPGKEGWEVLCRIGPRPLATRPWRQVNYRGSLNAAIAACLVELSRPRRENRYLNLMCGSGTLLIERLLRQRVKTAVGIDNSDTAVSAAVKNAQAAGVISGALIQLGDARQLEFPDNAFTTITADLPYGEHLGSRSSNLELYRATVAEATRVCARGGCMVLLSQDIGSLTTVLKELAGKWRSVNERRIVQREYRPACTTLIRL